MKTQLCEERYSELGISVKLRDSRKDVDTAMGNFQNPWSFSDEETNEHQRNTIAKKGHLMKRIAIRSIQNSCTKTLFSHSLAYASTKKYH